MLKIESITLDRGENSVKAKDIHTVYSWEGANDLLQTWATTAPQKGNGYHKVYYSIKYINGDLFKGRFDLESQNQFDADLGMHLLQDWEISSGRKKPEWMSECRWHQLQEAFSAKEKQDAAYLLDNYLIETFQAKPFTVLEQEIPLPDHFSNNIDSVLLDHTLQLSKSAVGKSLDLDGYKAILAFLYKQARLVNGLNIHDILFAVKELKII